MGEGGRGVRGRERVGNSESERGRERKGEGEKLKV